MVLTMQCAVAIFSIFAVFSQVNCIAFGGPAPTNASPDRQIDDLSPKPTDGPSMDEILRRGTRAEASICGYVDMDPGIISSKHLE